MGIHVILPALALLVGGPGAAASQEVPPGMDAGEMAQVRDLMSDFEAALEAEDAAALGRLFHPRGRLSDWRGRLARGPGEVTAAYRESFRAHRATAPFRLSDGREVRLGRSPQVALDVRFIVGSVRGLGDTAAVVDGRWRTEGALSPTGAPLTGEESVQGEGGPPYSGAYRLVAVLGDDGARVGLLHLDPYRATVDPGPAPGPVPDPGPEPGRPGPEPGPPEPDSMPGKPDPEPAPGAETPPPSSPVFFGTAFENYAMGGYRLDACTIHPDGVVTVAGRPEPGLPGTGEVSGDTLGRLPADSVALYTRLVREGVDPEPGPIESGGTADFGTVSFWVASPAGGDGEGTGEPWRVELASAGDVPRRPASPRTRRLALWIYASLHALPTGECTLMPPVHPDSIGGH